MLQVLSLNVTFFDQISFPSAVTVLLCVPSEIVICTFAIPDVASAAVPENVNELPFVFSWLASLGSLGTPLSITLLGFVLSTTIVLVSVVSLPAASFAVIVNE